MANFWRLSAVQLTSGPDALANLAKVDQLLAQLPKAEQHLAVLPEGVAVFAGTDGLNLQLAETLGSGTFQSAYATLAKNISCIYWLVLCQPLLLIQSVLPQVVCYTALKVNYWRIIRKFICLMP